MSGGPSLAARPVLAAIRGYQRWISPHKGFCCALRAMTGGASCSAPAVRNPWRHREQGHCDVPCDSAGCDAPGCDLPDLSCHGGHGGRACGCAENLLDLANCGCDIRNCGRANRRRAERCLYDCCGWRARRRRNSAHLDALARRIAERKRRGER